jgi:hypothetical protein
MIDLVQISQSNERLIVRIKGLRASRHPEISVDVSAGLVDESERFLKYVCDYLSTSGRQLKAGETLAYGYWLVKFQEAEHGDTGGISTSSAHSRKPSSVRRDPTS